MHVVLVEPEIHWNTGNIGRTCVATGSSLHLVGKLGFRIDSKEIRRAGLDYWSKLRLARHESFQDFLLSVPAQAPLIFFSTRAKQSFWDAPFSPESYLVFGNESRGLPHSLRERFAEKFYRIPINSNVRSLNLSTAAALALYEGLRRQETLCLENTA
ncbi:MAG: tRNA (cytidine(34)-2'-O)-methyltransferase [Elusimicrobiota bacterium]